MATKKKTDATDAADKIPTRVIVRCKTAMAWGELLKKQADEHWRRLRVEIQVREWILAGKPASLDAATAMVNARGLGDQLEVVADIVDPDERAAAAERIATDEGLCEFSRRSGHPGIWIPANNVKAGLKENWSVLGLRVAVRGSRGALAEGIFVGAADAQEKESAERDWLYLGEAPTGVHTAVSHQIGPKGPTSSIKRHEYVERPRIAFEISIANAVSVSDKISDDELAKTLIHFGEHGLGACRSQGFGRFDVVSVAEVGA